MEENLEDHDIFQNHSPLGSNETFPNSPNRIAYRILEAARVTDQYYTPLLCLIGTLGNSLSLAVFCMDVKYRSQSSSFYLSALAISDTGYLASLFVLWLGSVQDGIGVVTSDFMCPLVMYLGQVTCFISVYLIVAFTIERYVAVHYPFSRPRICTRSKAKKVITVLTITALLLYSYAWVIAKVIKYSPTSSTRAPTNANGSEQPSFNNSYYQYNSEKSMLTYAGKESATNGSKNSGPFSRQSTRASPSPLELKPEFAFTSNNHTSGISGTPSVHDQHLFDFFEASSDDRWGLEFQSNFSTISLPGSTLKPNVELDLEYSADNYKIHEERRICSVPLEYYKISEFANYIDSVATLIIPFFLITFINVRIAACVWKLKDQRQHIVAGATTSIVHTSKEEESESSSPLQERRSSCQYSETRVSCYQGRASTKLLRSHSERYKLCQQHRYSAVPEQENHDTNESDSEKLRSSRGFHQRKRTVVRFLDDACSEDRERATNFKWRPGTRNTTGLEDVRMMRLVGSNYAKMIALSYILVKHAGTPHQTVHSGEHANPLGSKLRQQRNPGCSSEVRVTKTLLLVSTVFLVLNLPSHAIRCMQFIQSLTGTVEGKELLAAFQYWANILFNTNFAVNFLLYCLSGRNFRKSLQSIVLRKCGRRRSAQMWKRGDNMTSTCTERLTSKQRHCAAGNNLNHQDNNIELANVDGSQVPCPESSNCEEDTNVDHDHIVAV